MERGASQDERRIGVLLAAGRGRRMGRLKQLLPWPAEGSTKPLVAAAFDSIAKVCFAMVVVLGHEAELVVAALDNRSFLRANSDPDAEMFASVRAGLKALYELEPRADVLLHPGDHPVVERKTLDRLIRVAGNHPECAVMPVYRGKGGHPVLIPAGLVSQIINYQGQGGLRQFWAEHPNTCLRLVVSDASVVQDMDTPDDYESSK